MQYWPDISVLPTPAQETGLAAADAEAALQRQLAKKLGVKSKKKAVPPREEDQDVQQLFYEGPCSPQCSFPSQK